MASQGCSAATVTTGTQSLPGSQGKLGWLVTDWQHMAIYHDRVAGYEILTRYYLPIKGGARSVIVISCTSSFLVIWEMGASLGGCISEKINDRSIPLNLAQSGIGYIPKRLKQYISFRECERPIFALQLISQTYYSRPTCDSYVRY